MLVRKKGYWY